MPRNKMGDIRKGEIALAILKYRMWKEGIHISSNLKRELGNISKETGVPQDELKEFWKIFIREFLKKTLASNGKKRKRQG